MTTTLLASALQYVHRAVSFMLLSSAIKISIVLLF